MKIGFIGVGNMGGPMCRNIIRNTNHEVVVFDVNAAAAEACTALGAAMGESVAAVAAACDVVFTSLAMPAVVEAVALGPDGIAAHARPGSTYIDLSTNSPATARKLRAAMAAVIADAGRDELLALILAHPELASKAALRGDLTEDSAREQAGAGLNACSSEELAEIRQLNDAYRRTFGWPFIVAVKGLSRQDIIGQMRRRLTATSAQEFAEALAQIQRIADLRLDPLLAG